jgi:hypothetical protein
MTKTPKKRRNDSMHSLSISKSQRSILKKDNLDLSERKTPNKVSFAD